jgi:hypothetical protein
VGIKAAHFLPLAAIGLLYATGSMGGPQPWPEFRTRATENLRQLLGERLQLWHLLAGVGALVAIVLLLARTGNDPGVGISGIEMKLRDLLDRYLVRPRTKEFLVGHPALLAAVALAAARVGTRLIVPLAVVGAIGQVSLVNSFCHLHTPLLLTAIRSFNGLWLGVLLGTILFWAIRRPMLRSAEPAQAAEPPLARTGTVR